MYHLKLLLHPIVRIHTRKCAANIVEICDRSLASSGMAEICMCKQAAVTQQQCHYLNIQEQTATSYKLHSGLMCMQGIRACMIRHMQSL